VRLEKVELTEHQGPVIHVSGVDLRDGTPIYDIKPYLPYVDSHPDAKGGFSDAVKDYSLQVVFPEELLKIFPKPKQAAIVEVLRQDPRPQYHDDPERKYGVAFAGYDVRFTVREGVLTVFEVVPLK